MQISEDLFQKWASLKTQGDFQKIVDENPGFNNNTITRAFKKRKCKERVYEAIFNFYKRKEERMSKLNSI